MHARIESENCTTQAFVWMAVFQHDGMEQELLCAAVVPAVNLDRMNELHAYT